MCDARGRPLDDDNAHPFPDFYTYFRHYCAFYVAINSFSVALKFLKGILNTWRGAAILMSLAGNKTAAQPPPIPLPLSFVSASHRFKSALRLSLSFSLIFFFFFFFFFSVLFSVVRDRHSFRSHVSEKEHRSVRCTIANRRGRRGGRGGH